MDENELTFATQNGKAKSEIVSQIARIVRKHGLDYEGWRYIARQVRKECGIRAIMRGDKRAYQPS